MASAVAQTVTALSCYTGGPCSIPAWGNFPLPFVSCHTLTLTCLNKGLKALTPKTQCMHYMVCWDFSCTFQEDSSKESMVGGFFFLSKIGVSTIDRGACDSDAYTTIHLLSDTHTDTTHAPTHIPTQLPEHTHHNLQSVMASSLIV